MKKKRIKSQTALTGLLAVTVGLIWLISMAVLTVVTAQEIYDRLYRESITFSNIAESRRFAEYYDADSNLYGYQNEHPDFFEYSMFDSFLGTRKYSIPSIGSYKNYADRKKIIRDVSYPMDTAVLYYDRDGKLVHTSNEDIIFFAYLTESEWDEGQDTFMGLHYGWIDISESRYVKDPSDDPYRNLRNQYNKYNHLYKYVFRIDAEIDGTTINPISIHYVTKSQIEEAVSETDLFNTPGGGYEYLTSDVDRTGLLYWLTLFDNSESYKGAGYETIYVQYPNMWEYEGKTQKYYDEKHENLAILTESFNFPSWKAGGEKSGVGIYKLNDLLVFNVKQIYDTGKTGTDVPEMYIVTAARSNPLSCAVSALRNIYIITLIIAIVLIQIARNIVKSHLLSTVDEVACGMNDDWSNISKYKESGLWDEALLLARGYREEQEKRWTYSNEIKRLNTALEYAKDAEENRKAMISAVAHELKTPLAVIHSYAEGLKEHIAEDKREKYLDIILSEAERTDQMVLEMLDLSRLEAGKVRLSSNEIDLAEIVRAVFEKLEIEIQKKNLNVQFLFDGSSSIVCDESRISQVIENFATNAVKYTPDGGNIKVSITENTAKLGFSIENECKPIPEDALSKVWDTFYRIDQSRSGSGTGLGLAIAKNIVSLHGGKCYAENTENGVRFGFEIPKK